ncbi:hypothetical protein [Ulvibacterium marinum]|uniref:hypothetical protein n=1 Tax=Ulvibacterium marinum TaxID=2419782 RepID=UPI002494E204|nr:hypothetical protein [Ulvibacterium marinum]
MSCTRPNYQHSEPLVNHFQVNDVMFENRFEEGSLPPSLFTHEAHLRLAWIYIKNYGEEKAAAKISREIEQFDKLHGRGDKFNKTVTIAAIKVVDHFVGKSKSKDFKSFIQEFPRLKTAFKELLHTHYSPDIFTSKIAQIQFIEPDLLPFP